MTPLCITCASCHRSWALGVADSLYLGLDLASRPCPHCEAYTLGYPGRAAAAPPPDATGPNNRSRSWYRGPFPHGRGRAERRWQ
jgi:hypothetical protein